jgi:hypothetical protein
VKHETINGIPRPQLPVKDWGTGQVKLENIAGTASITEVHHKADGAMDNGATVAFVIQLNQIPSLRLVAEITIYTLTKSLAQLGYQITPMDPKT